MTVQELIDELMRLEDKSTIVLQNTQDNLEEYLNIYDSNGYIDIIKFKA